MRGGGGGGHLCWSARIPVLWLFVQLIKELVVIAHAIACRERGIPYYRCQLPTSTTCRVKWPLVTELGSFLKSTGHALDFNEILHYFVGPLFSPSCHSVFTYIREDRHILYYFLSSDAFLEHGEARSWISIRMGSLVR